MHLSRQEEIIGALWAIAAIAAFGNGYAVAGWIFTIKSVSDILCSVLYSFNKIKAERSK